MLFLMVVAFPGPVWSAKESVGPAMDKAAVGKGGSAESGRIGGRGEGFEPEARATTGEEIPATFGPIITDTAIPMEKGEFSVQPIFGYAFVTDVFNENWRREWAGGDFQSFLMSCKLTFGLTDNTEVFVIIPLAYNWARNVDEPGPNGESSADSGGLADIDLTLKYRLVEETDKLPTVTALFATDFPTGKFKNLKPSALNTDVFGGGAYVFTSGFNLSKYIQPFIVYGNVWYSMRTSYTGEDGNQYPGDFLTVNLAAEYPITEKWVALLELVSFWGGGRLFGPKSTSPRESLVSILPGIEYMFSDKFSVAVGLNIGVAGKNVDALIAPLLSMIYAF
jgi:hypothetical protein